MLIYHWPGWVLFALTYLLIFLCKDARENKKVFATLFFVLSLHHVVAIINAFVTTTIGANGDAHTFHQTAIVIAQNQDGFEFGLGAQFYRILLAFFYKHLGPSLLLGEELSILAFLLSCFVFIKIYKLLGYSKYIPLLIILYGSLPSMILIGSITLRESWQILFFMLTIYFCLKNLLFGSLSSWFYYLIFSSILSIFHAGLIVFAFIFAGIMIFLQLSRSYSARHLTPIHMRLFFIVCTLFAIAIMYTTFQVVLNKSPELETFRAISQGHALNFIEYYRSRGMKIEARANYGINIDTSSLNNLLITFVPAFLYYMFAPFPWQISNLLDMYALTESLWRFLLIMFALLAWYKTKDRERKQVSLLILTYFMMSILWSLGTLNYGTSIRHHLVSYWILILLLGISFHHIFTFRLVRVAMKKTIFI